MTIDIAHRLVELRRKNGYSQEELAEKLGLSRQAVSKWERAEASPDTDNLIALAHLYGVSLDELVGHTAACGEGSAAADTRPTPSDAVHLGPDGLHVEAAENGVDISWKDIRVRERNGHRVHVDKSGVHVDGSVRPRRADTTDGLICLLTVVAYFLLGLFWNLWHPGWLVFLAIPLITSALEACRRRDPSLFAFPVLLSAVYLFLGFAHGLWHPMWVLYLLVPIYYTIFPHKQERSPEEDFGAAR